MKTLLKVNNLRVSFRRDDGWKETVHGIDFEVFKGKTLGIVGESGSGKSVSNLAIMRLLNERQSRISAETIQLDGTDISKYNEMQMNDIRGKRIAMIFQEPMTSLNPVFKCGYQVVEAILAHENVSEDVAYQRVIDLFKKVMLPRPEKIFDSYPHELSGGQKQRVMIAMALACNPELLIADEPTTALDVTVQKEILKLLRELQSEGNKEVPVRHYLNNRVHGGEADMCPANEGEADMCPANEGEADMCPANEGEADMCPANKGEADMCPANKGEADMCPAGKNMGMIFITHDLGVVAEIADYVAVMHNGEIVEYGEVRQVLDNPKDPYTKGLLACRPPLETRLQRLPVVKEFLDGVWKDEDDFTTKLIVTQEERKEHLEKPYSQKPLLKVEHLKTWFPLRKGVFSRIYDYVKAVDDVSFEVYPGETLGLVGESGCGKTTLGRSILRLIEPSEGKIYFDEKEITSLNNNDLRLFRKQAQIVFQDPYSSLNPNIAIGDAIAEPMMVHGIEKNPEKRRERVCKLLEEVGLEAAHYQRYPHEFSGGQRQRICIARALAVNPRLIICDESVSALDVSVQAQVLNLLNRLKRDFGFTYIFISHDLSVVRFMSDRILVMYNGKPVELGDADEIFNNPKNDYTKKLINAIPKIKL